MMKTTLVIFAVILTGAAAHAEDDTKTEAQASAADVKNCHCNETPSKASDESFESRRQKASDLAGNKGDGGGGSDSKALKEGGDSI